MKSRYMYASCLAILILAPLLGPQCCLQNQTRPSQTDDDGSPPDVQPNQPDDTPNSPAGANTYYVSPNGNNANPGTQERPWATPGHASRQLKPGDTLIILEGKYILSHYDDDILIPPSGRHDAWITIKGQADSRPVLAGRTNLSHAIDLSGVSYLRVENLEITHDDRAAGSDVQFRDGVVAFDRTASHVVLKDLYIHHIDEFGMNIQEVDGMEVTDCRIEYCGFGGIGGPAGQQGGVRNLLIRGCRLSYSGHYYRGTDGAGRPYDRPDGFGIEESQGPVEIRQTVAEHNYGDGLDSKAANTTLRDCIVANNSCDGIKLWAGVGKVINCLIYGMGDGVGGSSPWAAIVIGTDKANARFEIINTTVHDNPTRQAYPMYVQYDRPEAVTVVMINCIVANGFGVVFFGSGVNLTADNNLFYRGGGETEQVQLAGKGYGTTEIEQGALGTGNVCRDPAFVRPAWGSDGDYHLQDGSHAIDAGTPTNAPGTDLQGNTRPKGKGYDMGAYER